MSTIQRIVAPLNRDWRFGGAYVPGSEQPAFDDAAFDRVTLPHANVRLPWHGFDESAFQFESIYRRQITLPETLRGRRVFVQFDGIMTATRTFLNGEAIGSYDGGYLPSLFELTEHLRWGESNTLAAVVDSRELPHIPPFGGRIDYLTFGGIYREARLLVVPTVSISNAFVKPVAVLDPGQRRVDVQVTLDAGSDFAARSRAVGVRLLDPDGRQVGTASAPLTVAAAGRAEVRLTVAPSPDVRLWDLDAPQLYTAAVTLAEDGQPIDEYRTRLGFREARFTPDGFFLNGRRIKLRGLNRHQTYPYVGGAMPARVQRRDAVILKRELKLNIVRTSHYPQSTAFLDACDELGLLVLEEIPGWQHIGDDEWQQLACRDVREMIERDWNHPSIVLWGVRINESPDNHAFYEQTNRIAHQLDDSRQTGGVRNRYGSERLEDVFTFNEFLDPSSDIRPPNHPHYLVTEFGGHMYPTKPWDGVERVQQHVLWHARMHAQLASHDGYAGGIGWCAFDYNTHADFGSGDRVCYHGVSDIFRIGKPAAALYRSQCDPAEEIVLEPTFPWAMGDCAAGGPGLGMILSNVERLKLYVGDRLVDEVLPDRGDLGYLPHAPFFTQALQASWGQRLQDLRIEGYIGERLVATRRFAARATDAHLLVEPDDRVLHADGSDATRVVFRVVDADGNRRPFSTVAVVLEVDGPGESIGDRLLSLSGGVGAVWIRSTEQAGTIAVTATTEHLGSQSVTIRTTPVEPEPY
ncbi:MAG: glycoside hydrolase family 2 protein [Chloroflexi bacterium]|nr:glycoside hydrolase family 2 protein [Chloroflexota bacterium]